MAPAPLSTGFQPLPQLPTIKLGPSAAGSWVGGRACACPRPLWVSPTTSPVRLGVSPAAAPTPRGVFNQRFEALFPRAGALGYADCFAPLHSFVLVYLCASVGPRCATRTLPALLSATLSPALLVYLGECGATGSASGQTACPVRPTLRKSRSLHGHVSPLCPGAHLCPSYRSGCMFLFYLLGVRLPCRLIFCQFWLCEEVQCVYLRHHLDSRI